MSKQLVKKNLNVDAARSFVFTVKNDVPYYIFAANSGIVTSTISTPVDSNSEDVRTYDKMLFGKRIKTDDIKLSTKRYNWQLNQVYDMYDDTVDLSDKRFYVAVDGGIDTRVYKCLFNNNGAPSTVEPSGTSTEVFESLSDGYIWKYMYTISKFYMNRFATLDYIPVIPDTDVIDAAIPGTIDVVQVKKAGAGYDNYVSGEFGQSTEIRVNGNPLVYEITNGNSRDDFYTSCMIKISSTGEADGQYRLITSYKVVNGKKLITIDNEFSPAPIATDSYEITPNVIIEDLSDTATQQCFARAIISANTGNNVSKIEIMTPGVGYRKATATVQADRSLNIVGNKLAEVRPIISPDKGHGADPEVELLARYACVSGIFNGNSGFVVANNTFNSFGLLKEPLYANCQLTLDGSSIRGLFTPGETLFRYKPIKLAGNVQIFSNNLVIGTNTTLIDSLREDDSVVITNGLSNVFGTAKNINYYTPENANAQLIIPVESFNLEINREELPFVESNCSIYLIEKKEFAECIDFDVDTLTLTDVNPTGFELSAYILGDTSYATAKVSNTMPYLTINGRDFSDFESFNQLTRLVGERENTLSTFVENEPLSNDDAQATFHSFELVPGPAADYVYVTDVINTIQVGTVMTTTRNEGSQTRFRVMEKYDGELVRDSGDILYIENVNTIRRRNEQTELVKLVLEF